MIERKHLNATEKQDVRYCVETWVRDEQIKQAIARVKDRIKPHAEREEPIAIVCFGPSLQQTWEQVKDFKYVMSCSGSHKFLVEHGITPDWHVEVDPREHKVGLIGPPQKDTTYLISSTCHRKVFDHLEGHTVQLWHVFDASEDGKRLLPPGEWAITGGCDVGLRALTIAGFLGFRDLHVFGMDHSAGTVDAPLPSRHAAFHPNSGKSEKYATCEYDGRHFLTTAGMLEAARQVWHELDQMPAVKATFYGDGLCQAMSRNYVPKPTSDVRNFQQVVAVQKPELISAEYLALNAQLHHDNLAYGVGGGKHAPAVIKLCEAIKTRSVLDYGCGKGYLAKALDFPVWEYDPAIPEKSATPRPADLVICSDVLEHIEPEKLLYVLDDLRRCVKRVGFFIIHTGPAQKVLADGRNAHLIQRGEHFWRKQLSKFFDVGKIEKRGVELYCVVGPKLRAKKAVEKASAVVAHLEATA
jgi:2-polyprenyl-3-methyl-5-hydroxy-6-metoxy-1,4-benzoquinol methylase